MGVTRSTVAVFWTSIPEGVRGLGQANLRRMSATRQNWRTLLAQRYSLMAASSGAWLL